MHINYKPKPRCVGINIKYKNTYFFITKILVVLHNLLQCVWVKHFIHTHCRRLCKTTEIFVKKKYVFLYLLYIYIYNKYKIYINIFGRGHVSLL